MNVSSGHDAAAAKAAQAPARGWETVVGLEVHAQLKTQSKLFCSCANSFGGKPNTRICPVCSGMPGALPTINRQAVVLAVKAGLALGCTINVKSVFSRKSYFYPDLPNGFQTSQLEPPICEGGSLAVPLRDGGERIVRINRIHMEDDAGKCLHEGMGTSLVDLNRAGTPLIEVVTEPDLRGPAEAAEFMRQLRRLLVYLDVTDGNMEEGNMRCDVNISLRPVGSHEFGIRSELKNLNSFNSIEEAAAYEVARQREVLESGGIVSQETRLYDPDSQTTRAMRSKEEAPDYRYFPNPDLPVVSVSQEFVDELAQSLPESPHRRSERFCAELGLHEDEVAVLTASCALADYFENALSVHKSPKRVAALLLGELLPECARRGVDFPGKLVSPRALADTAEAVDKGVVSLRVVHEHFAEWLDSGLSFEKLAEEKGLLQVSDSSALEEQVKAVIEANPAESKAYRGGKTKLLSFFVGQVMKASKGAANPGMVSELLRKHLG